MTISEIAKLAGVSSAAVSRYLNDGSLSQEKTSANRKGDSGDQVPAVGICQNDEDEKEQPDRCSGSTDRFRVGAEDIIRHLRTYGSEELSRIADEFKSESGKRNRDSGNL